MSRGSTNLEEEGDDIGTETHSYLSEMETESALGDKQPSCDMNAIIEQLSVHDAKR